MELLLEGGDEVVGVHVYLVCAEGVAEDYDLLGRLAVAFDVGGGGLHAESHHACEFLLELSVALDSAHHGGEGGVNGGSDGNGGRVGIFGCLEGHYHSRWHVFGQAGHPESVASLGDDLQKDLSGDGLQVSLSEGALGYDLAHYSVLVQGEVFHLFVLSLHVVGQHYQTYVAPFVLGLAQHCVDVVKASSWLITACAQFDVFHFDLEVATGAFEGIKQLSGIYRGEVDDSAHY